MSRLSGKIVEVSSLSSTQRDRLFDLMNSCFLGVVRDRFERDLLEKPSVILLEDKNTHQIQGFSTLLWIDAIVDDLPIKAVFSGDTVVDREYWGETELGRLWIRSLLDTAGRFPQCRVYWFLISMGYRTYRALPLFFKDYYPRWEMPTPTFDKKLLDVFGRIKLGSSYDARTGVVHHDPPRERLKPGISEITALHLENPVVRFFAQKNPHHQDGDELACIARVSDDNLTSVARKLTGR